MMDSGNNEIRVRTSNKRKYLKGGRNQLVIFRVTEAELADLDALAVVYAEREGYPKPNRSAVFSALLSEGSACF